VAIDAAVGRDPGQRVQFSSQIGQERRAAQDALYFCRAAHRTNALRKHDLRVSQEQIRGIPRQGLPTTTNVTGGSNREEKRCLVGARGFEPPTPCAQGRCATRLRYAPTVSIIAMLCGCHVPPKRK
jgi:hypothetical protein